MDKIVFEQDWDEAALDSQDGGQALIYEVDSYPMDVALFVRLQSWDETKQHIEFNRFRGKRLRVTVETID